MPGWKLLPLLTRSFANRDKDVRSRKRTRVERRETTTRWNTTKRAKVWIVIFFGLVPRWWSRARVPFRNSALRCFVPRFIRMKRGITRVSRCSGPFDLTKRKIYMEQLRDTNDQYRWSFPRLGIYLVVTRSRCYSDFGNDLLSIDFWRVRDSRSDSSSRETRLTLIIAIRFSILDRSARWSKRRATIKMRLDSRWREKGWQDGEKSRRRNLLFTILHVR